MQSIPVGEHWAYVDDVDYERVSRFNWRPTRGKRTYAMANIGPSTSSMMHRFVLGLHDEPSVRLYQRENGTWGVKPVHPQGRALVHHKSGNGLDNRRCNLIIVNDEWHHYEHGSHGRVESIPLPGDYLV